MDTREASQAGIDRFIDALWLEDGLSGNTLAAYRLDLQGYADWLGARPARRSMPRRRPTCWPT